MSCQKCLEIGFGNPDDAANPEHHELAAIDPAPHCALRHVQHVGDGLNGEEFAGIGHRALLFRARASCRLGDKRTHAYWRSDSAEATLVALPRSHSSMSATHQKRRAP